MKRKTTKVFIVLVFRFFLWLKKAFKQGGDGKKSYKQTAPFAFQNTIQLKKSHF